MLTTILGFLGALIGFLVKVWPDKKTQEEVSRDRIEEIRKSQEKFETDGDTSDLGRIPK